MKDGLAYVSRYFKAMIIPRMPEGFKVAEPFRHGLIEEQLEKGMAAYRDFLYAFFDKLVESTDTIDVKRGGRYDPHGTKGDRGTSSIKDCFPVFFDIAMILLTLGFHGSLETKPRFRLAVRGEDIFTVICPVTEKYQSLIKMSPKRKLEMLRLLSDLGLQFEGADFSREVDFAKTGTFYVTSARDDSFALGLKLAAQAAWNHKYYIKMENLLSPVILWADFYSLQNAAPKKHVTRINEYSAPQAPEIRAWIKSIDELLMKNGCTVERSDGKFQYTKRGKGVTYGMVCKIRMDITGCFISPGVNCLEDPDGFMAMLPNALADEVVEGAVIGRFDPAHCHRRTGSMGFASYHFTREGEVYQGCRHAGLRCQFSGMQCPFTIYEYDLVDADTRQWMRKWVEMELAVWAREQ